MQHSVSNFKFDSKFLEIIKEYADVPDGAAQGAAPGATPGVGPNLTGSTPGGLIKPNTATAQPQSEVDKAAAAAKAAQMDAQQKEADALKATMLQANNRLAELQKLGIK